MNTFAPLPADPEVRAAAIRRASDLQSTYAAAQADHDNSRRAKRRTLWPAERQRLMQAWTAAKAAREAEGVPFVLPDPPSESCPDWWLAQDDSPRHVVPIPTTPTAPQTAPGRDSLGRSYGKVEPTPEMIFAAAAKAEGKRGLLRRKP